MVLATLIFWCSYASGISNALSQVRLTAPKKISHGLENIIKSGEVKYFFRNCEKVLAIDENKDYCIARNESGRQRSEAFLEET